MRGGHLVVVIRLEVLPDPQDPEGTMRLKRLLKWAGRPLDRGGLALRCQLLSHELPVIKPQPDPAQAEDLLGPQQPPKRTRKKKKPPTEGATTP